VSFAVLHLPTHCLFGNNDCRSDRFDNQASSAPALSSTKYYEFEGKVDGREVDIEIGAAGNEITIADDFAI